MIYSWKTIIDFTEINPDGVPVEDILKSLNKYFTENRSNNANLQ
jgi:hypothetical protein